MDASQTITAIGIARQRLNFEDVLLTAIEQESGFLGDVDDFNPFGIGLWTYDEPDHVQGLSGDVRRTWALEWLRTHARLIQRVARRMGHDGPVTKFANDGNYGVEMTIYHSDYVHVRLTAQVPSQLTCEMVPTGEVEHIPARDVPVMERRCPESIFAGIEHEAVA